MGIRKGSKGYRRGPKRVSVSAAKRQKQAVRAAAAAKAEREAEEARKIAEDPVLAGHIQDIDRRIAETEAKAEAHQVAVQQDIARRRQQLREGKVRSTKHLNRAIQRAKTMPGVYKAEIDRLKQERSFRLQEKELRAAHEADIAKRQVVWEGRPRVLPRSVQKHAKPYSDRIRSLQTSARQSKGNVLKRWEIEKQIDYIRIQQQTELMRRYERWSSAFEAERAHKIRSSQQTAQSRAIQEREARALGTLKGTAQKGTPLVIGSVAAKIAKAEAAGLEAKVIQPTDPTKGPGVAYGLELKETLKVSDKVQVSKATGNIAGGLDYKVKVKDAVGVASDIGGKVFVQPTKDPDKTIVDPRVAPALKEKQVEIQVAAAKQEKKELEEAGLSIVEIPTMTGESFLALAPLPEKPEDFRKPKEPLETPVRKEIVDTLKSVGIDITPKPEVHGPRQPDPLRDFFEGVYYGGVLPLAHIVATPKPIIGDITGGKYGISAEVAGETSRKIHDVLKPGPTLLGSTIEQVAAGKPLTGTGRGFYYDIGSAAFDIGTIFTPVKKIPLPVSVVKFGETSVIVASGAGKITAIATIGKTGKVTRGFDIKQIGKQGFKEIAEQAEERAKAGTELDALGVKQVKLLTSEKGLAKLRAEKIFAPEKIELLEAARVGIETAKKLPKKWKFRDLGEQPFKDLTVEETKVVKEFFKKHKLTLEGSAIDIVTIRDPKMITKAGDFDIHVKGVKQARELTTELVENLNKIAGPGRKFVQKQETEKIIEKVGGVEKVVGTKKVPGTKIEVYETTGEITFGAFRGQPLKQKFMGQAIVGPTGDAAIATGMKPKSIISGATQDLEFHHITKGATGRGVILTKLEHAGITALQGQLGKIKTPKGAQKVLDILGERSGTLSAKAEQRIAGLSTKEKEEISRVLTEAGKQVQEVKLGKKLAKVGEFLSPDDPTAGGQVAKTGTVFGFKTPKRITQKIEGIKMRTGLFQIHRRTASVTSIQLKGGKLDIGPPANIPGAGPQRSKDFPRLWASLKTGASIFRERGDIARAIKLEKSAAIVRREGEKLIDFEKYFKANPLKQTYSKVEEASILAGVTRYADDPTLLAGITSKFKPTKDTKVKAPSLKRTDFDITGTKKIETPPATKSYPTTKKKGPLDKSSVGDTTIKKRTLPYISGYKTPPPKVSIRSSTASVKPPKSIVGKSPISKIGKPAKQIVSPKSPLRTTKKPTLDSPSPIKSPKRVKSPTISPPSPTVRITGSSPRGPSPTSRITSSSPRGPSPIKDIGSPSPLVGSPRSPGSVTSLTGSPPKSPPRSPGSPDSPGYPGSPGSPGSPGYPGTPGKPPKTFYGRLAKVSSPYLEKIKVKRTIIPRWRTKPSEPKYRPVKPGADFIGNVPVDKIVGTHGRAMTIYGREVSERLARKDVLQTKRKYKNIVSRTKGGAGLLGGRVKASTGMKIKITL